MSDFHFKDEDNDLGSLPSVQGASAATPNATPPNATPPQPVEPFAPPTPPKSSVPSNALNYTDDDLSILPSVEILPPTTPMTAPSPSASAPSAPAPSVPSPPLPKIPSPQIPSPAVPNFGVQQAAPATQNVSQSVPSPTLPASAATPTSSTRNAAAPSVNVPNVSTPNANAPKPNRATMPNPAASNTASPNSSTVKTGTPNASVPKAAVPKATAPNAANVARKAAPTPAVPLPPLTEASFAGELERRQMTTSAKPKVENVHLSLLDRILDFLTPPASWLFRTALVLGGVALLYLLWGVFSGALARDGNSPQIASNVGIAINVFRWSLLVAAASTLILMWDERFPAPVTVFLGLLLAFGSAPALYSVGNTSALGIMIVSLSACGRALMWLGLLKFSVDLVAWIIELPHRMRVRADVGVAQQAEPRQQREAANSNMFSPCWKLPFCREVIRKQCPAYLAKTTCWKFGRGCYCDEEMISRIIRGESLDAIKAPTRMSRQSKPPCHRCYIFLEHQGLKYKIFSPLAVPATIAIVYFGWPTYIKLTGNFGDSLNFLWNRLAFQGGPSATDLASRVVTGAGSASSTLTPLQVQHAAQNMFGVLLGFYLLIMMSKGIEWAIYKARL